MVVPKTIFPKGRCPRQGLGNVQGGPFMTFYLVILHLLLTKLCYIPMLLPHFQLSLLKNTNTNPHHVLGSCFIVICLGRKIS
jgi:hypothetical protein